MDLQFGSMLTQSSVNSRLVFSPDLPVNYVLNAKAGCSTILSHLWKALDAVRGEQTFTGNPHDDWPWGRVFESTVLAVSYMSAKRTFTMVRNPYARALSGYLSKVGERSPGNLFTWQIFREHFGLRSNARPSFESYLDMIAREPVEMMDMHWAPQALNLMQPAARIDEIFYIEDTRPLKAFLEEWTGQPVERSNWGPRSAADNLRPYYSDRAIDLVRRIYAADFEMLGYSDDYTIQESERPIRSLPGAPAGITPLLKHMASGDWQEKLVFLDEFEQHNGTDFATAVTRFCCGGPEDSRIAAAEKVLHERPENWLMLREIEHLFRAHADDANAARFAAASRKAREIIKRK